MSVAERIVDVLLESDDVDPKAFTARHSDQIYNTWEQVGGDVDWWEFGGTFHNEGLGQLVHVPGIEAGGLKEWSSWDIKLTPADEAAISVQFPKQIDPDYPEDGDENEQAREDAYEKLREERAEKKNADRRMPVYRWLDDNIEDYASHFEEVERQTQEPITSLGLGAQWDILGQIIGYHEFDDQPDRYTYAEIDAYLQPREDFKGRSRQQHHLPDIQ